MINTTLSGTPNLLEGLAMNKFRRLGSVVVDNRSNRFVGHLTDVSAALGGLSPPLQLLNAGVSVVNLSATLVLFAQVRGLRSDVGSIQKELTRQRACMNVIGESVGLLHEKIDELRGFLISTPISAQRASFEVLSSEILHGHPRSSLADCALLQLCTARESLCQIASLGLAAAQSRMTNQAIERGEQLGLVTQALRGSQAAQLALFHNVVFSAARGDQVSSALRDAIGSLESESVALVKSFLLSPEFSGTLVPAELFRMVTPKIASPALRFLLSAVDPGRFDEDEILSLIVSGTRTSEQIFAKRDVARCSDFLAVAVSVIHGFDHIRVAASNPELFVAPSEVKASVGRNVFSPQKRTDGVKLKSDDFLETAMNHIRAGGRNAQKYQ